MTEELRAKRDRLRDILTGMDSILVAYSGGVDSALSGLRRHRSASGPRPLRDGRQSQLSAPASRARAFASPAISTCSTSSSRPPRSRTPEYRANEANRCYYCKHELYTHLSALALERGFAVVADGSNADDRGDYRPGRQAAREFGVRSPLDEADLTKDEIRALSREMRALPTADEPASACLSSRIPYLSEVTEEKLRMIEQAEDVLRRSDSGSAACGITTRSPASRSIAAKWRGSLDPEVNAALVRELKAIGYKYVSLDLQGYRMGSLNEVLRLIPA